MAKKGSKLSEEHKRKIGAAGKGRVHSLATRAKLSAINLANSELLSARQKGLIKEGRVKMPDNRGRKLSASHRANLSAAKRTPKELARMRAHACNLNVSFDRRSKLEGVVEAALAGEAFEAQFKLSYFVFDFAIPSKRLLIEVDGCYWHGCFQCGFTAPPANKANDERKNRLAKTLGWELIRIPEHAVKDGTFIRALVANRGGT